MPAQTLLNIEPDKLFEDFSVSEIEEVQKKLNNEIERKREELRTVVGERYRDLIEAADTITQMKALSEKIISDVKRMKTATTDLQERQVSGFKIEYHPKEKKENSRASSALQVKILVDISERIWEAVDDSDFTKATLLFLLARYIKTSLELSPGFKTSSYFPVVSRQWFSLSHFKSTILSGAEEKLKNQHDSKVTCSCLLSLALLENLTTDQLLERYLKLRSDSLRVILTPPSTSDTTVVKQRLCDSYSLLIHSIIAISHCFLEHFAAKDGLLIKNLNDYIGPQSPPTLRFLDDVVCDIPIAMLPSAVKQFRPILEKELSSVSESQVSQAVSSWLSWVQVYVKQQGGLLLQHISSLRSLHDLRHSPQVSEEWPLVAQRLCAVDLWGDMYRCLITERAQQLVSVHWDSAFRTLQQQINQAHKAAANEIKQSEVDLVWYMWKESANDLRNLNDFKTSRGLWLKAKGVTPRVAELCVGLEQKISSLVSELVTLCPDQEVDPLLLAISQTLRSSQQTVCASLITRLVEHVRVLGLETTSEEGAILLAKFLQSVPELCPSLSKCLSSADTKWQESHSLLQSECQAMYRVWISLASDRLLTQLSDTICPPTPTLNSIPQWEEIIIEEEGESGEKIQSVLKVPCTTSLNLQSSLHRLMIAIGRVAVPKQIAEQLLEKMLGRIIEIYETNLENHLTQTQFLQLILDMKYLIQLFNSNISKDLKMKYTETISQFESKIDPFDLNVFTPYLNNNVLTAVQQTQSLLGLGGSSVTPNLSLRNEEPSVLATSSSSSSNLFPLLHITAPRINNPVSKPKSKKIANLTQPIQNNLDTGVKTSTTSSFFGAMASDWFG